MSDSRTYISLVSGKEYPDTEWTVRGEWDERKPEQNPIPREEFPLEIKTDNKRVLTMFYSAKAVEGVVKVEVYGSEGSPDSDNLNGIILEGDWGEIGLELTDLRKINKSIGVKLI